MFKWPWFRRPTPRRTVLTLRDGQGQHADVTLELPHSPAKLRALINRYGPFMDSPSLCAYLEAYEGGLQVQAKPHLTLWVLTLSPREAERGHQNLWQEHEEESSTAWVPTPDLHELAPPITAFPSAGEEQDGEEDRRLAFHGPEIHPCTLTWTARQEAQAGKYPVVLTCSFPEADCLPQVPEPLLSSTEDWLDRRPGTHAVLLLQTCVVPPGVGNLSPVVATSLSLPNVCPHETLTLLLPLAATYLHHDRYDVEKNSWLIRWQTTHALVIHAPGGCRPQLHLLTREEVEMEEEPHVSTPLLN